MASPLQTNSYLFVKFRKLKITPTCVLHASIFPSNVLRHVPSPHPLLSVCFLPPLSLPLSNCPQDHWASAVSLFSIVSILSCPPFLYFCGYLLCPIGCHELCGRLNCPLAPNHVQNPSSKQTRAECLLIYFRQNWFTLWAFCSDLHIWLSHGGQYTDGLFTKQCFKAHASLWIVNSILSVY